MFLKQSDFTNLITQDHLSQVMDSNPVLLAESMREAQSEIENYLRGKFDLEQIFVEFQDWQAKTYPAGSQVWQDVTATIDGETVTTSTLFKAKTDVLSTDVPGTSENWEINDPRHPQIRQFYKDVTLYHIHSSISPNTIPELRVLRYKDAIKTLNMIKDGSLYTNLPKVPEPFFGPHFISQERNSWMF